MVMVLMGSRGVTGITFPPNECILDHHLPFIKKSYSTYHPN